MKWEKIRSMKVMPVRQYNKEYPNHQFKNRKRGWVLVEMDNERSRLYANEPNARYAKRNFYEVGAGMPPQIGNTIIDINEGFQYVKENGEWVWKDLGK